MCLHSTRKYILAWTCVCTDMHTVAGLSVLVMVDPTSLPARLLHTHTSYILLASCLYIRVYITHICMYARKNTHTQQDQADTRR